MYIFILTYSLVNLLMLVVSKLVWLALKNIYLFRNNNHARGFLSLQGLTNSVKGLNLGKSPGSDGLSVKFYLHFREILGPLLLRVANEYFRDGDLCDSMKGSVTRLIFKKRGDCKNFLVLRM